MDQHLDWINEQLQKYEYLGQVIRSYNFGEEEKFLAYAGTFHPFIAEIISKHSDVLTITKDPIVRISAQELTTPIQWGLARLSQRMKISPSQQFEFRYNERAGEGTDVYVIDTGVFIEHDEFEGRALAPKDFVSPIPEVVDDLNGHGTHVAGIVGGKTYGVAKRANIISLKCIDSSGVTSWSSVISGIEYAVRNQKKTKRPSVINLSVTSDSNLAVDMAVEAAVSNGLHVVVAAGNTASDACFCSPARAKGVISVGASTIDDVLASYSNYGACVHIHAPGDLIPSAWITSKSSTYYSSGTSMASPHVAGAVSIILSQVTASPAAVARYLKASSRNTLPNDVHGTKMLYLTNLTLT